MNNLKDISEFIDNIDLGVPIYNISKLYNNEFSIELENWEAKQELCRCDHWLKPHIGQYIHRKYSVPAKKMTLINKDSTIKEIRRYISNLVNHIVIKTSPAEMPKRTKVYKQLSDIAYRNRDSEAFVNDLIPVINYYYSHVISSTDSSNVHRKNVFGLLDILRKKYEKSSN